MIIVMRQDASKKELGEVLKRIRALGYKTHIINKHSPERGQVLFFAGKFMDFLLLGVFFVFGLHTLLWFVRSLKAMRERRGTSPPTS